MVCCALWGSATPAIKTGYQLLAVEGVPSIMLFAGLRFTLAGIFTVIIFSIFGRKVLIPKRENLGRILFVSIFHTILQYIFFYLGLSLTSGVKGTVASGSGAFFAVLIASLIFKQEKLIFKKIAACIIGFAGIVIINLDGLAFTADPWDIIGVVCVLLSTVSSSFASVLMKKFSSYENPVVITGYQFIVGGLVMILIGLAFGGTISFDSVKGVAVLTYLAFLSAVAYALWGILLKYNPVSRVSVFSFMTPVFGVILSKLMLTETSNVSFVNVLLALMLICIGIFTLNYQKRN
jgi:drug/metabolite transporter (DMT)-like permease